MRNLKHNKMRKKKLKNINKIIPKKIMTRFLKKNIMALVNNKTKFLNL